MIHILPPFLTFAHYDTPGITKFKEQIRYYRQRSGAEQGSGDIGGRGADGPYGADMRRKRSRKGEYT